MDELQNVIPEVNERREEGDVHLYVDIPVGRQFTRVGMYRHDDERLGCDVCWWGIFLAIYSKRRNIYPSMDRMESTGTGNPFTEILLGREAVKALEQRVLEMCGSKKVYFFCEWTDKRRRDAYLRALSPLGYSFGRMDGRKVLIKGVVA